MNIIIEMPLAEYDRFVERCEPVSHEYALLKNAIIVRRQKEDHFERILQICCRIEDAEFLRDSAKEIYPAVVPCIEKAIAFQTEERPSQNSPHPMQLRHHPLMSCGAVRNWPPQWTPTRNDPRKEPFGEAGILMDAVILRSRKDKCFLMIKHDGKKYMGCLAFDDPAFCLTIYRLLKRNIGNSIKEIGDFDLSYTL